jgi:hypothetical protein
MRKLLILMLVLGLSAAANAVTVDIIKSGATSTENVNAGDTVAVDIKCDTASSSGFEITLMQSTSSSAGNATATAVGDLHANFTTAFDGNLQNKNTDTGTGTTRFILIDRIAGTPGTTAVPADSVFYDFSLKIPAAASVGDTFTVGVAAGQPFITFGPFVPYSYLHDGSAPDTTNNLVLTVIPEPATIALLGLGGLLLRRRR